MARGRAHQGTHNISRPSPSWKAAFLEALRAGHTVSHAAKIAGIGRRTAYRYRAKSPQFDREWDEALQEGLDNLLEIARARALDLRDKASAQLLMFLIRIRLAILERADDSIDII